MAFARPDLIRLCMKQLSKFKPPILYIMGDGPRNEEEARLCNQSRKIAENPKWDCKVIKIYKERNQGITKSFIEGMASMFNDYECGIYLEDDILLSESFYKFSKELLIKYRKDDRIGHINATNSCPTFIPSNNESYMLGNHVTEWGFATWKRVWEKYDVNMSKWENSDKNRILKKTTFNSRSSKSLRAMFDLHCNNPDPHAWGYQWHFNCLDSNLLSITPVCNMSLNLGFGRDDSTNTFGDNPIAHELDVCEFPLVHPSKIERNKEFDRAVENEVCPSHSKIFFGKLNNLFKRLL